MNKEKLITTAVAAVWIILSTACAPNNKTSSSDAASGVQAAAPGKSLQVDGTHLIVPIATHPRNSEGKFVRLGIYDGDRLLQNFNVSLPLENEPYWLAT